MLFSMQEALRKRNEKKERKQNLRIKRPTFIAFDSHCNSLGVCIVGGADTVLSSLYIDQVDADGAAARDGRLQRGDRLLKVNEIPLRNCTHAQAIALLREQPPFVRLQVQRNPAYIKLLDQFAIQAVCDIQIELPPEGGAELGILLSSRPREQGIYITHVYEGKVAAANGGLQLGDRLIKINGLDVSRARPKQVCHLIKQMSGGSATFQVSRMKQSPPSPPPSSDEPTDESKDDERRRRLSSVVKPPSPMLGVPPEIARCSNVIPLTEIDKVEAAPARPVTPIEEEPKMLTVTLAADPVDKDEQPPVSAELQAQLAATTIQTTAVVHNEPEDGYATAAELTPPLLSSSPPTSESDVGGAWNTVAVFLRANTIAADHSTATLDSLDEVLRKCIQTPSDVPRLLDTIQINAN